MSVNLKPLPSDVTDHYAPKSARLTNSHDKPKILDIELNDATEIGSDTIDTETRKVRRTFKDAAQAYGAYKRLKTANNERTKKNQLIQKKLNNEPPRSKKKLESMGQNWRSNRPTGFISTMISRIQPPFRQVIENAATLTYTIYPLESADAEHKTKTFRKCITKTIRSWKGHPDLLAKTAHENTTFGYCAWSWEDTRDWKPEYCRGDYTFFPLECSHVTNEVPIWGRKKRFQIYHLLPVLEDPVVSALAGWHIDNLVKAINAAVPASRSLNSDEDARRQEDWIREGSYGAGFESDAKYVEIGELFVREPHGKVSRFVFSDKDGQEICTQLDRFNNMAEALNLFSVDEGSDTLMSSRGAGRDLYNDHIQLDQTRNLAVDNFYLSNLLLLKKGQGAMAGIAPLTVAAPCAYVSDGYDVQPQTPFKFDTNSYLALDKFITGLAEIKVGTFLPGQATDTSSGQKETASEVNRVAAIENQLRQGILMRWATQYTQGVERMQRGICHPEHVKAADTLFSKLTMVRKQDPTAVWVRREVVDAFDQSQLPLPPFMVPFEVPEHLDEDAIACVLEMLEANLSPADILFMAFSPATELLQDTTQQDAANVDAITQRYQGNSSINQTELMKLDISTKLGETKANSLILPANIVEATQTEAVRQQIMELQSIVNGQEIPVSARDDDMTHLKTMAQKLEPIIKSIPPGGVPPNMVQPMVQALKHFKGHLDQAAKKGIKKQALAPFKKQFVEAEAHMTRGHNIPDVPQGVTPAAAHHHQPHGHQGHAPQNSHAAPVAAANTSMSGIVGQVSAPPKPATAA